MFSYLGRCEEGWEGLACDSPKTALPKYLLDTFTSSPLPENWLTILGGEVEDTCSVVGSGTALHFTQVHVCSVGLNIYRHVHAVCAVFISYNVKYPVISNKMTFYVVY